jgi:RimJ/RimL family protein N-acetyltransferase
VIRLVRPQLDHLDAALAGDPELAQALGVNVVPGWASFTEALRQTRDAVAVDPSRTEWGTRLFVAGEPAELVGWGGFKGPPDDGVVEVGYEIAESRRNRGLATDAVHAMVAEAAADAGVTSVLAHTLPEQNASTRVLEKAGFAFDGEAEEHGERVWRWRLARVDGNADRP